jgi:hypothetical protein
MRLETVVGLIKSYNSKSLAFMGLSRFIHQFLLIGKGSERAAGETKIVPPRGEGGFIARKLFRLIALDNHMKTISNSFIHCSAFDKEKCE